MEATNLPVHLTPLIGRDQEIAQLRSLLRGDSARLVTLTGPGGVGKTRLAQQALWADDEARANDVVFVGLAPISDPALVPAAVAQAIDVREAGDLPLTELVRDRLRSWSGMLVLDNFEQVIPAAPFVSTLLLGCPRLKVLVTSRTVLRVSGEREFAVPPMTLPADSPSVEEAMRSDAVRLFVERAQVVRSGFALTADNVEPVVEICRRLDGLPLAIELAASRAKILSPAALLARLNHRLQFLTGGQRDQPDRHQTIRAATSWSYDLLSPEERSLFRRLSVFAGGFSLDAAEAVCGEAGRRGGDEAREDGPIPPSRLPASPPSVLDGIASLVDKSLLVQREGPDGDIRFGQLETIREFGLECLAAAGEESTLRQRHADHYLTVAEETGSSFTTTVRESSLALLQIEHPNFRQALAHHSASGAPAKLLRMAGALAWFWHTHAHLTEGMGWLEEALRRDDGSDSAGRAKALLALALMVRFRGESDRAIVLAEESLALYLSVGDEARILEARSGVGFIAYGRGDTERVEQIGEEIVESRRKAGDGVGVAIGLTLLAFAETVRGEHENAIAHLDEALRLQRAAGDSYWAAHTLSTLGYQFLMLGELTRAAEVLYESLEINWRMGNKSQTAWCLFFLAILSSARGRHETAARLVGAEVALRTAVGAFIPPAERHQHDKVEADLRVRLGSERFTAAYAAGLALTHQEAVDEALAVAAERPSIVVAQSTRATPYELTERELEVLALVVEGLSDREIGDRLYVSHRTAQKHVSNIFIKLNVGTRTAAATVAIRAGLVAADDSVSA